MQPKAPISPRPTAPSWRPRVGGAHARAPLGAVLAVLLVETGVFVALYGLWVALSRLAAAQTGHALTDGTSTFNAWPILPTLATLAWAAVGYVVVAAVLRFFLGGTVGELIWGVRLGVPPRVSGSRAQAPLLLTVLALGMSAGALVVLLASHPVFLTAEPRVLLMSTPSRDAPEAWRVQPIYYAVGSWPRRYEGQPVLFSLPYAKGPPSKFVGSVTARWAMPEIRVTFEGPRTSSIAQSAHACLVGGFRLSCLRVRERVLGPHVREMLSEIAPKRWRLEWFRVESPGATADAPPLAEGLWLSAYGRSAVQERVVLISERGTQQVIRLDRGIGPRGDAAHDAFAMAIASLRMMSDLKLSRSLANTELARVRLASLKAIAREPQFAQAVADVQSLLISKISVDPALIDSYFHLGGTAMLLAEHAKRALNSDWGAVAKRLITSSYQFAADIKPQDRRTRELERLMLESKRF